MRPFPDELLDPQAMACSFITLVDAGGRLSVNSPAVGRPDLWVHAPNGVTYRVHGHAAKFLIDKGYIATFIQGATAIVKRKVKPFTGPES